MLQHKGPLLLASNHPNSFLDAILLCILFNKSLYALTRGDTFKKKWIAKILYHLHMLPVYREREGVVNLHRNYDTFNKCLEIFKNNGIILVFSEALCVNEWHLRPVKKGTARLAALAWEQHIALQVLPVGLNYSNFNKTGKIVHVNFGNIIEQKDIVNEQAPGAKILNDLTKNIQDQLSELVYEISDDDNNRLNQHFNTTTGFVKKILLFIPAMAGMLFHAPLIALIRPVRKKIKHTGHADAVNIALLFLIYPFYITAYVLLACSISNSLWGFLAIPLLPFFAWSYLQVEKDI